MQQKRRLRNFWTRPTTQMRFFLHSLSILLLAVGIGVVLAVLSMDAALVETHGAAVRPLLLAMFGGMAVLGVVALVSTVVFVHHVVGPIVPLERAVDALAAGDFSARVHLRKYDEFRSLGDKLNILAERLQSGELGKAPASGPASPDSSVPRQNPA